MHPRGANEIPKRDIPIMLYDGDCEFCRKWIEKLHKITGEKIQYIPYQFFPADENGKLKNFPQILVTDCKKAIQLISTAYERYQAAGAVFRALAYADKAKWLFWLYKYFPGFKFIAEMIYKFIAGHRYLL